MMTNQLLWAPFSRDSQFNWKSIEPHCHKLKQLFDDKVCNTLDRVGADYASASLFQIPDMLFNLCNMLLCGTGWKEGLCFIDFHVHRDHLNIKACLRV